MPTASSASKPVIIVGGGLSGLAAAVELASRNIPVLVLEQKPRLGGRAYSFVDATTGDVIDNGQHVLIAGYEHTLRFLERLGTKHLLAIQENPTLHFHHPARGFCEFTLPALPSPLHLLSGIVTTDLFSFSDKLRMMRAGFHLHMTHDLRAMTICQWLDSIGQTEETKRSFWEPLAISIMNEHIGKASAKVFVESLRHAFLRGRKNSALVLPRVGLNELYVDAAASFLAECGGKVQCNADVVELSIEENSVTDVKLRDGSTVPCATVILAVPHYRLLEILPPSIRQSIVPSLDLIGNTPIISIHLWFERDFMPHDVVGLIDRRVQWVFNKRTMNRDIRTGGHISCVISGAEKFVESTNEELVQIAIEDLQGVFEAVPSTPTHSVVIREKRATFSCTPEAEKLRPQHQTGIRNLFLAGDWTATGFPATIEGAIISGERCAALAGARTSIFPANQR